MTKSVRITLVSGLALLGLGLIFGVGGTVLAMIRAFSQVASSGSAQPSPLSDDIKAALEHGVVGVCALILGLVITLASVIAHFVTKRKPHANS